MAFEKIEGVLADIARVGDLQLVAFHFNTHENSKTYGIAVPASGDRSREIDVISAHLGIPVHWLS